MKEEERLKVLRNFVIRLGSRLVLVGDEIVGECDGVSFLVEEATFEEVEKLKEASEIRLIKKGEK